MDQPGDNGQAERFGRYRVTKVLGRGGMGVVYLGKDPRIGRDVAIKVIRTNPETPDNLRDHLRKRFEVEAHSAGTLSHPNIVTIYDIGEEGDAAYIAMEYVRGESLEHLLRSDRSLSLGEVADLTAQLCHAMDYAHAHGVIHRDIKPANVLLTRDGQPKIVDFGVAKMGEALGGDETRLTQAGSVIGTPAYMSPEQVTGKEVTAASDQFSLGVIVYEMLAGRVPFEGEGATTLMYKIVHEEVPALTELDKHLPGSIDEAVGRALAKSPADRYETCEQFARAVRRALESPPKRTAETAADQTVLLAESLGIPTDGTVVLPSGGQASGDATVLMGEPPVDGATVLSPGPEVDLGSPPPPAPGARRVRSNTFRRLAVAVGAVVVTAVLAMLLLSSGEGTSGTTTRSVPEPQTPAEAPAAAPDGPAPGTPGSGTAATEGPTEPEEARVATWWLRVAGDARGAEIWIDGEDTGESTPDEVELLGRRGEVRTLELRRDGVTLASTEIELGPFMPREWTPRAVRAADAPAIADNLFARSIDIRSRPRGAEIWLDGRDTGERTPARLTLEGQVGDRFRIAVREGARTLDDRTLILGPNMPSDWTAGEEPRVADPIAAGPASANASAYRPMQITSRPEGATVFLDGDRAGVTPLDLELDLSRRHELRLELAGHRTAGWAFDDSDLNDTQRDSGVLHFPLAADAPPGRVRITAPGYAVAVRIGGRSYEAAATHELELPAGEYTLELEAPGAHFFDSRQIRVAADGIVDVPLPMVMEVQIAATPGNCRVSIDGRFVDTTPFALMISAGDHNFEFFWPALGKTMYEVIAVTRPGQRVFASVEE